MNAKIKNIIIFLSDMIMVIVLYLIDCVYTPDSRSEGTNLVMITPRIRDKMENIIFFKGDMHGK